MKISSLLPVSLFFLIALCTVSCQKDDENPETTKKQAKASINLERSSYSQYEMAKIEVENVSFSADEYVIQIDTATHYASVVNGNLFFLTPDFKGGSYDLTVNVDGNNYSTTFTIVELLDTPSPEAYISEISDSIFNFPKIDSSINQINVIQNDPDIQKNRMLLSDMQSDFNQLYAQLNAAEKATLAKFIKANEEVFKISVAPIKLSKLNYSKTAGKFDTEMQEFKNNFAITAASAYVALASFGYVLSYCKSGVFASFPCGAAAVLTGAGGTYLFIQLKGLSISLLDKTFVYAKSELSELSEKSFQLNHNQTYEAEIRVERRTLYKEDGFTTVRLISDLMFHLDESKAIWNEAADKINGLAQFISSSKDYKLVGKFPHPADKEKYKSQWFEGSGDFYSIQNISNPLVELKSQSVVNDKLVLKFVNKDTSKQQFNFDLVYDDGSEQAIEKFSATLGGKPNETSILGTWNLVSRKLRNQTYSLGQWYMYSSYISTPNCYVEVFDFRLKDVSSTFIIRDSTIDFSESNVEQNRTVEIDSLNCVVSSYGPWDKTSYPSGTDYYHYELISDTQMRIREVGTSQSYISNYSYDGTQFILNYDTDEYLVYER